MTNQTKEPERRLPKYLEIRMGDDFSLRIQESSRAVHLLKECIKIFLEPQFVDAGPLEEEGVLSDAKEKK